jgi:intein/homing endonuclease/ssDNA-binding Zn-finger/Zn-ribbon topoisomerase 1
MFVALTKDQFENWADTFFTPQHDFLKWEFKLPKRGTELVICATLKSKPSLEIHIYTTVDGTGKTRDIGEDAIRNILYDTIANKIICQEPKVLRTEGNTTVFERITLRVNNLIKISNEIIFCKKCGSYTVERTVKATGVKFMGCAAFPNCGTKTEHHLRSLNSTIKSVQSSIEPVYKPTKDLASKEMMTDLVEIEDCYLNNYFPHFKYGFKQFNRVQSTILKHGYWHQDCNLVLGTATSTGKTISAELFVWETLKVHKKKICYVSPLKALTLEKFNDWTKSFGQDYKICILTGDFVLTETKAKELNEADIICCTSEMTDSYPYETELYCYKNGNVWKDCIGNIVEDNIDCEVFSYHEGKGILPTEITGRIKIEPKDIYKVSLIGGRSVEMTECHNLFILDKTTKKLIPKILKDIDIEKDQVAISTGFETLATKSIIPFAELLLDLPIVNKTRTFFTSDKILNLFSNDFYLISAVPSIKYENERLSKTTQRINDWRKRGYLPLILLENSFRLGLLDINEMKKVKAYHSKLEFPAKIEVDNDLAWALGFFVADGCCVRGPRLTIEQKNDNLQFLERAQKVFGGNITSKTDIRPIGGIIHTLHVNSVLWQYIGHLFGGLSREKSIPDFVFTWEASKIESFLNGMLCGDGFFDNSSKNRHLFRTASFQLSKDIQNLTLLVGRFSFVIKNTRIYKDKEYLTWDIRINENNPRQRNNLNPHLHFVKIKSIEFLRKDIVYDLEIQPKNVSYPIQNWIGGQGGIMLHNSRSRNYKSEKSDWLFDIGLIITDESSLLTTNRGHALEVGIMRFSKLVPSAKILMLSATMPNVSEFKTWLTTLNGKPTEVINNNWRPTVIQWNLLEYDTSLRYADQQQDKLNLALECYYKNPNEKTLIFVHDKNTGRMLESKFKDQEIDCLFYNADLEMSSRTQFLEDFAENTKESLQVLISTSGLAWGSVSKDTLVTMSNGTEKLAKDIKINDEILSWNEQGYLEQDNILNVLEYGPINEFVITLENGKTIIVDRKHPFYCKNKDNSFSIIEAQNLTGEEDLFNLDTDFS